MKKQGYHIIFALALLCMLALGSWWGVFFMRAVELERSSALEELRYNASISALNLGHSKAPPAIGKLPQKFHLEVTQAQAETLSPIRIPCEPNYPDYFVSPTHERIETIERKINSRRFMVLGESALLFTLLGIFTFMLHQLVRQERSHLSRMQSLVSSITHEMKTPLAGIKSLLQTFLAGRVTDDKMELLVSMGLKETDRLEHMVENILISRQLRSKDYDVDIQEIEVSKILKQFIEHRFERLVGASDQLLLRDPPAGNSPIALGDPRAVRIILDNLTDNGFKYGGTPPKVALSYQTSGDHISIVVEDNGIGFTTQEKHQLFSAFSRPSARHNCANHGTGLGLAISKELAVKMNGDITASSDGPGEGSRFELTLRAPE